MIRYLVKNNARWFPLLRHMPPKVKGRVVVQRPTAKLPIFTAGNEMPIPSAAVAMEHPLVIQDSGQSVIIYMRIETSTLLLSRSPNASTDLCIRSVPLKSILSVISLSKHQFELRLIGMSPMRFEAYDAWACKQWLRLLEPLLEQTPKQVPNPGIFPVRNASLASLSPRNLPPRGISPPQPGGASFPQRSAPRLRPLDMIPSSGPFIDVDTAVSRGWRVNAGPRGIAILRKLATRTPS